MRPSCATTPFESCCILSGVVRKKTTSIKSQGRGSCSARKPNSNPYLTLRKHVELVAPLESQFFNPYLTLRKCMKLVAHARKSNSLLQMQVHIPNTEVEVKPVADNYTKNVLKDDLAPCPFPKSQEEKER